IYLESPGPLGMLGKSDEAVRQIRRAVAIAEQLAADDPKAVPYLVTARLHLASALTARQPAEAEKILRRNLPLVEGAQNLEATHRFLGDLFRTTRRWQEAEAAYRQALKHAEQMAKKNPSAHWTQSGPAMDLRLLASVLVERPEEAEKHLRRAVVIYE